MKRGIFEEQTTRALKNWHKAARERNKMRSKVGKNGGGDASPSVVSGYTSGGDMTPSIEGSPIHLLHKYKQKQSCCSQPEVLDHNNNSSPSYLSDAECSEPDNNNHPSTSSTPPHNLLPLQSHNINFSFSKPSHT